MSWSEIDLRRLIARVPISTQLMKFLVVGGSGYVVDVVLFNLLATSHLLGSRDPAFARVLAMAVAMVVTFVGNRALTWRQRGSVAPGEQVSLFVVFNLIGLVLSLVPLVVTHDVLGMTSRLADNISANVVGIGLGTWFRFWAYDRFVFLQDLPRRDPTLGDAADVADAVTDIGSPKPTRSTRSTS